MTTRQRIRAETSFVDYRDRERLRSAERIGILGKQDGTLDVSGRVGFVYVRLDSDPRKLIMAMCPNSIQRVADLPVAVRRVWTAGAPSWTITGRSPIPVYSTDPMSGTVASHASQHQRGDLGTGGFDPLDVYDRMLLQTRIQAQATPNMTVYLTPGPYLVGGAWHLTAGGSSAAFVAPSNHRCDLVYIKSDLSLTILQGVDGASPGTRPSVPDNCCPLAYVWLDSTTTSITETCIEDARLIAGQTFSTSVHDILSDTHADALAASPQVDDLIYANLSPAWARLAKGGDGDVLTINASTHHVAWGSPQCVTVLTHDHSGDGADGGTFDAANLTSDSANDGYVLTADGGGGAAWESVVAGSITVKEQDGNPSVSNVSEIRVTNGTLTDEGAGAVSIDTGGGSGAPTNAEYVTTAANVTLSNEIAIPGFASHGDRLPASPNAEDDEFDASTLDAKWTEATTAAAHDHDTTWPSHVYCNFTGDQYYWITQNYAPAGNFSLTACFHYSFQAASAQAAITVFDDDTSDAVMAHFIYSSGWKGQLSTKDATVWTYGRSSLTLGPASHFYIHLQRDTNTWSVWISFDGLSFWRVGTYDKTFTIATCRVQVNQNGSTIPSRAGIDWVRRDWLTL